MAFLSFTLSSLILVFLSPVGAGLQENGFEWKSASPASQGLDAGRLQELQDQLARRGTKTFLLIRNDRIVWEWYAPDHGPEKRHYTASLAKSLVGGMSLLLAMQDGAIEPDHPAHRYIPKWKDDPLRSRITIRQLATHSSGIQEAASPETGMSHDQLPGWKGDFWRGRSQDHLDSIAIAVSQAPVVFEPGTGFEYSNPGMAALSYAVTAALKQGPHTDIRSLLEARVMAPLGIGPEEWQIGYGRTFQTDGLPVVANWGGGGFTARAVARVGRLLLRRGEWQGRKLVDPRHVEEMLAYRGTPLPERPPGNPFPAPALGWYNNADGVLSRLPRDAFMGAGAGNQVLLAVPSLNLIVVRNGAALADPAELGFWGGLERHLFNPVMEAMQAPGKETHSPPYPPSPVIESLQWAPASSIIRKAEGGDNWPMTWADDDSQYTAYGDGWGFEPLIETKLSMGFAKVTGPPDGFQGTNVRSPSGETLGQGADGQKASGILMVDGILYLWVRNAGNSRLAWSRDHGKSWSRPDWTFTTSFAAPTFLNFGKNYAGSRDDYVYSYSFDSDSAYVPADRMVLARVPARRILEREAYEFFVRLDESGRPQWSRRIEERGAVFSHPGRCYRSGISYNQALKRYLWAQILPGQGSGPNRPRDQDPRFQGGFGVYDAPEPWGPWSTAFYTGRWDVGPGETASFPTKWMSPDGLTLHLVFSGDDFFSVRRAEVRLR